MPYNGPGLSLYATQVQQDSVAISAGSETSPTLAFIGDLNNGIFSPATDNIAITTNGEERFRIDENGKITFITDSARSDFQFGTVLVSPSVQIEDNDASASFSVTRNSGNANGPSIYLGKSRGSAAGSINPVEDGDRIGSIVFNATDGVEFINSARIESYVNGSPGTGVVPGSLSFLTTTGATPEERMVITASGNVGIGITNPSVPLQVSDGNAVSSSLITSDYIVISAQDTAPGFSIVSSSSTNINDRGVFKATRSRGTLENPTAAADDDAVFSLLGAVYDGTSVLATAQIQLNVDGAVSTGVGPQRISFWTGLTNTRTEKMRIDSAGNVGIGTTDPTNKLEVYGGDVKITAASTASNIFFQNQSTSASIQSFDAGTSGNRAGYLDIDTFPQLGTGEAVIRLFRDTNTTGACKLAILKGNNSTTTNHSLDGKGNALFNLDAGNVGIGTDDPSYKLHVEGDLKIADGGTLWFSDTASSVEKIVCGTSVIDLYADSNIRFFESDTDVRIFDIDVNNGSISLGQDLSTATEVLIDSSGSSYFNGGNVGIGTNIPTEKLHVEGGTSYFRSDLSSPSVKIGNSTSAGLTQISSSTAFLDPAKLGQNGHGYGGIVLGSGSASHYYQKCILIANKHATTDGIAAGGISLAYSDSLSTAVTSIRDAMGAEITFFNTDRTNKKTKIIFQQSVDGTSQVSPTMTISESGNVGIGTADPDALFHVHGTGRVAVFGNNAADPYDLIEIDVSNTSYPTIAVPSSNDTLQLKTLGSVKIAIDSNDNSFESFSIVHGGHSTGGKEMFYLDENGNFTVRQSVDAWTNSTSHPIIRWDYKTGPGDLLYLASGGNTSIADQMAMVISDTHGLKVGRSGWDGSEPDISSSNEFFRITNAGNVGIATNNPSAKLHVHGTALFSNTRATEIPDFETTSDFNVTHLNRAFDVDTPNPPAQTTSQSNRYGSTWIHGYDSTRRTIFAHDYYEDNLYFARQTLGSGSVTQIWQKVVTSNESGNVGINTTPSYKLDIYDNYSSTTTLHIKKNFSGGGDGNSVAKIYATDDGYSETGIRVGVKGTGGFGSVDAYILQGLANSSTKFVATTSGNVGIGTADPQAKLDIESGHIEINGSAIGGIIVTINDDAYANITPPIRGGQFFMTCFSSYPDYPQPTGSGSFYYDVGPSRLLGLLTDVELIRAGNASLNNGGNSTSTTATDFTDGRTTVTNPATDTLRIFNRSGGVRTYKIVFL